MELENQIPLRLRFEKEVSKPIPMLLENVKKMKEVVKPEFHITTSEEHIWLHISRQNKKYYSPHLHLELEKINDNSTKVKGLFGPDPALWSFFMFLHFGVAGLFLLSGIIAYSNWSLGNSYMLPIWIMCSMVLIWFVLYFIARSNRKKGIPQAKELENLMLKLLE
ncbi:MAG: hypothetical protein CVU03_01445 [Bacteroidetes bacterium HGW-Bacteroidetes-2]|jgi:hypothetical protein|nr:MAG: hypothetical protein CVU03_01445 [Bacteroidetes bacterium HGW-Bacteroidetes-2]